MANTTTTLPHPPHPPHPYYPLEAEVAGFLANEYSVLKLLSLFASGCLVILSATNLVAQKVRPGIPASELATVMWFVLSGSIHLFFEGYFVYHFRDLARLQTLFAQLWKEYAHSDSRYLTQDPFVLCMESITAVTWGPLSFLVGALITTNSPLRHPLQTVVSLGQLYGDVLYYATNAFDHHWYRISYSRPEPFYFWGYYVFMNLFWIVIPLFLIYQSTSETCRAFVALDKASKSLGRSRSVRESQQANGPVVNKKNR